MVRRRKLLAAPVGDRKLGRGDRHVACRQSDAGEEFLARRPPSAGSIIVTNSGLQTQESFSQYLNDAVESSVLEVHTPSLIVSPALGITISRFLGRDGEERDHFLEFAFNGLQNYSQLDDTVHGSIIPFYNTTPFIQQIPAPPPIAQYFQGSLVSPFPIFLPLNGNQQQLIAPSFSSLGRNYDEAFNRSDMMSSNYVTSYDEFELNYRFAGHNQPDQLVMNPNGRWYRQCQTGYYYSYFFGIKGMVIDEDFNFLSSGSQFAAINNGGGNYSPAAAAEFTHQGTYGVHTYNTLLGLQTGGKLEYRFCRWTVDTHGNAGMFLNIARQDSRITTSFTGTPDPASTYVPVTNTDNSFSASSNVIAFAGGFGVAGSYKFRPNLVGHVSYDMTWVGDIARAPEQMEFSSVPETSRDNHLHQRLGILQRLQFWNRVGLVIPRRAFLAQFAWRVRRIAANAPTNPAWDMPKSGRFPVLDPRKRWVRQGVSPSKKAARRS